MPPARSAARSARSPRRDAAPRRRMRGRPRVLAGGATAIRWDRVSRVALLFVLVVLVYLYAGPAHSYWDTVHQAKQRRSEVAELKRENAKLRARREALRGAERARARGAAAGHGPPGRAAVRARSTCPRARSRARAAGSATRRTTAASLAWVADVLRHRDPPVARGRAAARRGRRARSARPSSASPTPSTASCAGGSAARSRPTSSPTSTTRAPTGRSTSRSASRPARRGRGTSASSPTPPSPATCARPRTTPAAGGSALLRAEARRGPRGLRRRTCAGCSGPAG